MATPSTVAARAQDCPRTPIVLRVLAYLGLCWLLIALHALTNTACDFPLLILLIGGGFFIGVLWIIATGVLVRFLRTWQARCYWLAVPVAGAIGLMLATSEVGFRWRVALSESALTEMAEGLLAGGNQTAFPRRVGLFWVKEAQVQGGVVYFYTSQSFINREGLAYSLKSLDSPPRMSVKLLSGPWYLFVWRF